MSKYRVVCIDKDDIVHEAEYEDEEALQIMAKFLKDFMKKGTTNMYSLTIYENEKVVLYATV